MYLLYYMLTAVCFVLVVIFVFVNIHTTHFLNAVRQHVVINSEQKLCNFQVHHFFEFKFRFMYLYL